MPENTEQTFWEQAVGVAFNTFWDDKALKIKRAFASLIDIIHEHDLWDAYEKRDSYLKNTFRGMAIRACITAQMAAVKFITFKD